MRKSKFTKTQILGILREAEADTAVADLLRKHQISRPTFSLWKKKYGGVGGAELQRLKELERENARLTRMYADQALELTAIKRWSSRRSRMSSPENCNAVCEASRCDDLDRGTRAAGAARLSDRPMLADRVLSGSADQPSSGGRRRGCAGHHGLAGGDRTAWALGLLDVLRPSPRVGVCVEPQASLPRVLCARLAPGAADEEACAEARDRAAAADRIGCSTCWTKGIAKRSPSRSTFRCPARAWWRGSITSSRSMVRLANFAVRTARSLSRTPCARGARPTALCSRTSSPGSPTRMPTSSASIVASERRSSMPGSSPLWPKCAP